MCPSVEYLEKELSITLNTSYLSQSECGKNDTNVSTKYKEAVPLMFVQFGLNL